MSNAQHSRHTIEASDGHVIHVQSWRPAAEPQGVVQLLHGLGEHSNRYARFGEACAGAGYVLVAHDHRGHGEYCETYGFFATEEGWHKVVKDALAVQEDARSKYPELPLVLFGHSMGSYIAQAFAMEFSTPLAGLLLSGSTWPSALLTLPARLIAVFESWRIGKKGRSKFLNKLAFGDFNKPFEPAQTEMDWLSRDGEEVAKYVSDPLCGGEYTNQLWRDLLRGLSEISKEAALRRIPSELPIMIMGGADDPVGGDDGLGKLAFHYAQTGHSRLKVKIYPEGRHEMLNETNRDEVTADLLEWISACIDRAR